MIANHTLTCKRIRKKKEKEKKKLDLSHKNISKTIKMEKGIM